MRVLLVATASAYPSTGGRFGLVGYAGVYATLWVDFYRRKIWPGREAQRNVQWQRLAAPMIVLLYAGAFRRHSLSVPLYRWKIWPGRVCWGVCNPLGGLLQAEDLAWSGSSKERTVAAFSISWTIMPCFCHNPRLSLYRRISWYCRKAPRILRW